MQIISRTEATSAGLTHYFTGKPCKFGHIATRSLCNGSCRECTNGRKRALRVKPLFDEHLIVTRDDARAAGRIEYFTGKLCVHGHLAPRFTKTAICQECNRLNSAKRRSENPEYMQRYRQKTRGSIGARSRRDPKFKMLLKMREMVRRVMRLTGGKRLGRTIDVLGYSPAEFVTHIESQFKNGMSWKNHGEWHIDHIIPLSLLLFWDVTDPAIVNGLENLQPLWAAENMAKSNKVPRN